MGEYGENPDPREERFERYLAEQAFLKKEAEILMKNYRDLKFSNYQNFYERGKFLDWKNFGADAEEKRTILKEEFPRRFDKNGKQPLDSLDDLQIGALFKNVMTYSEKRINQ